MSGAPVETVLTHPAAWGAARCGVLVGAARSAGLDVRGLVPEPIAAASYFTAVLGNRVKAGRALAVYDFGAGTFDASVLARTARGFREVAVGGLDSVGGLDLDEAIVAWLATTLGERHPEEWRRLTHPASPADLRARRVLWDEVRGAKEALSRQVSTTLFVPLADSDVLVTRDDLERIVGPLVTQTVAAMRTVLRQAGPGRRRVADLFLVGGSSRVPLVATLLHRRLGIAPVVTDQPELVVAEGSLHATVNPVPEPDPTTVVVAEAELLAPSALSAEDGRAEPVVEVVPGPEVESQSWPEDEPVPVAEMPPEPEVEPPPEPPAEPSAESSAESPAEPSAIGPLEQTRPWHKVLVWSVLGAIVLAAIVINTVSGFGGDSGDDTGDDTGLPPPVTAPPSGSGSSSGPASGGPAPAGPWLSKATVAEVDDLVMSHKVLARRSGNTVNFLDPATGKDTGSMSVVAPAGVPSPAVQRVTLVDTADDTVVVFFYRSTYKEDGLSPERGEHRVQARLRSTGQQTLDTALTLGGDHWEKSSWSVAPVVATDPGGYLVLNYLPSGGAEPNLFHVVGLLPGLKSWTASEDCCPRSIAALAANGGVLLASRVGADDELRGYDLATGQQLWRRGYRNDSILNLHPDCARAHKGTFIVRDDKTPMILDARTGAVVRATNGGNCLAFDSASSTGVQTKGALTGYDLDTGNTLWTIPSDRVRSLDLKVVGVYRGRVYVTTHADRLVLDARTGTEVSRGWTVAPKAGYGSWVVGFDHPKRRESVYPGTG